MDNRRMCLDLGCGSRKREGYFGVDITAVKGVDIACDIEKGLPFKSDSIDSIWSNHFFEHISDTIYLFKEIYRISKNGAIVEFRVPYYKSATAYKDPTHKSVIVPEMMRYFSGENWYGADYGINTKFKLLDVKYDYLPPYDRLTSKKLLFLRPISNFFLRLARRFLWDVAHSVTIRLEAEK